MSETITKRRPKMPLSLIEKRAEDKLKAKSSPAKASAVLATERLEQFVAERFAFRVLPLRSAVQAQGDTHALSEFLALHDFYAASPRYDGVRVGLSPQAFIRIVLALGLADSDGETCAWPCAVLGRPIAPRTPPTAEDFAEAALGRSDWARRSDSRLDLAYKAWSRS